MSEWRKDPVTERWVIIATERSKRPSDYCHTEEKRQFDFCALCEGHEGETPPEVLAFRRPGSKPNSPGWWIRVVSNKFPAVKIEGELNYHENGIYLSMNGIGAHEVIIEATEHEPNLEEQAEKQIEEVIWAWRERSLDLRKDKRLKYIQVFKNYGVIGGASLEHAHSQLIAIPKVPIDISQELTGIRNYAERNNSCLFCDMIKQESKEKTRIIFEGSEFIFFAPFASRFPFETWILPKKHQHDFVQIQKEQINELSMALRTILSRLSCLLCNPPYNLILHTSPINEFEDNRYHWHFELLPRLTFMAGFEFGTGYYINPTPPELAAKSLKEIITSSQQDYHQISREVLNCV